MAGQMLWKRGVFASGPQAVAVAERSRSGSSTPACKAPGCDTTAFAMGILYYRTLQIHTVKVANLRYRLGFTANHRYRLGFTAHHRYRLLLRVIVAHVHAAHASSCQGSFLTARA